jgi:coenzyme F420 hydrogenase subunit beta
MDRFGIIDGILRVDSCSGCGICESITGREYVVMDMDEQGFLRPRVRKPLRQDDSEMIKSVCPALHAEFEKNGLDNHLIWGPVKMLRAGFATDEDIRYKSSSGGAISALLTYLLESDLVDFVLHVGSSTTDPVQNENKISECRLGVIENTGSRYSPSAPLTLIKGCLDRPGLCAVVGKPCDIAALRRYARQNPKVDQNIRYMISFFCAGIPSLKGTFRILQELGIATDQVDRLTYRGDGWPGKFRVQTKTGKVHQMTYEKSWGTILNKCLQLRCKVCPDGVGDSADIVCADGWYIEDGIPDFGERDGRSIILTRTERGEHLVTQCIEGGGLRTNPFDIDELPKIQPHQALRRRLVLSRLLAMKVLLLTTPKFSTMPLLKVAVGAGLVRNTRSFIGMLRRSLPLRFGSWTKLVAGCKSLWFQIREY